MKPKPLAFAVAMALGIALVSCVGCSHDDSSSGKRSSASSQHTQQQASVKTPPASQNGVDWGGSSIYVATTSKVTLALWKDGKLVAKDNEEVVADSETDKVYSTSRVIEFSNAPPGNYELRVAGKSKTRYDVEIHDYDSEMSETVTTHKGVIGKTGVRAIPFKHRAKEQNSN
jgi:hypothetical protein